MQDPNYLIKAKRKPDFMMEKRTQLARAVAQFYRTAVVIVCAASFKPVARSSLSRKV